MPAVAVVGVPSSAGSYAAGQDQAPRALRDAGLWPRSATPASMSTTRATRPNRCGRPTATTGSPRTSADFERAQVAALGISVTTQADVLTDPVAAAARALRDLPEAPFAVHVDVDVLDFTDAPLAENTSGRNVGPTLDQLAALLTTVVADPRWRALSIGELNPTRTAGDPSQLTRFVAVLTGVLGRMAATGWNSSRGRPVG